MIPVKIYFHTTLIKEHLAITEYIFDKMLACGLMDYCDSVSVGALGEADELVKLEKLLSKYPKARIVAHDTDKNIFEFHTLRHLKKDVDTLPKFYALYCHSKSVTFGKEDKREDVLYERWWKDYMTKFVIEEWRRNYRALDLKDTGYDICGVRIIPARHSASSRTHASGNFWFASSEYLKTLPRIDSLDLDDRFEAEMWSFSGMPITYISCNAFTVGFPYEEDFETHINNLDLSQYTI